jgi:hypothetical protein
MKTNTEKLQTNHPKAASRSEWLAARLELLEAEKELTRRSDELAQRRQELPWVRVDKEYRFDTDAGTQSQTDSIAVRIRRSNRPAFFFDNSCSQTRSTRHPSSCAGENEKIRTSNIERPTSNVEVDDRCGISLRRSTLEVGRSKFEVRIVFASH